MIGDLDLVPTAIVFLQVGALRSQLQSEPDATVKVTLQLMLDEAVAELDRRNKAVLAARAAKGAAS
jgi:hypothetical protein